MTNARLKRIEKAKALPDERNRIMQCLWCAHQWFTRVQGRLPIICPRCRSIYWATEAQHVPKKELGRIKKLLDT